MAKAKPQPKSAPEPTTPGAGEYTVVARRYRPQQFAELVGQEHVAQALVNALQSGRVAHAYLFTGARGVGKTSAARILAKALNCESGPTPTPCDTCDSCKAVAAGEDVDVLEIDGASNNKVEEVRDLRQNVGFRPTRGRYKIYIIDEVHMLSTSAFNALLKTLEEPPPHVKFIFATTEVQKIPVTILSRCQRFDFAHIGPGKIFDQLRSIIVREGYQADDDALRLVARRAGGSMRDSQSLLDQLLASAGGRLTAGHVNAVLGSAGDERVTELAAAILARDPKAALDLVAAWVEHGLQVGELVDQLIGYWRALMLVSCGGSEVRELPVGPSQKEAVLSQAKAVSLDSILAGLDVWTATRGRMRDTGHAQVLLEMAAVRLCRMDELLSVGQLVTTLGQIGAGGIGTNAADRHSLAAISMAGPSKKNEPVLTETGANVNHTHPPESTLPLNQSTLPELVSRLNRYLAEKAPILASHLKFASSYAISGPNSLAFRFDTRYDYARAACVSEANTRRIQDGLCQLTGQVVQVRFDLVNDPEAAPEPNHPPAVSVADRKRQLMTLPLFQKAGEVLGAMIWHMDDEFNPVVPPRQSRLAAPDTDEI